MIYQNVFSEEIIFNTKEILIKENGRIIEANDGEASSEINNFTINGKKFFFDKEKLILKANDSLSEFKNDNIKVKSQDLKYSKNKFLIEIKENVEITDLNHEIKIFSDEIFYDLKKKIIYSNKKTQIRDNNDNKYEAKSYSKVLYLPLNDKYIFIRVPPALIKKIKPKRSHRSQLLPLINTLSVSCTHQPHTNDAYVQNSLQNFPIKSDQDYHNCHFSEYINEQNANTKNSFFGISEHNSESKPFKSVPNS